MANGTSTETAAETACAPPPPGAPPSEPSLAPPPALLAPQPSQLNRLIDLWHAMSEDDQAFWRDMFASNKTPDDIREELRQRLDVLFLYNDQLEIFKRWEKDYQARTEEAARQRLDERLGLTPFSLSNPAAAREAFFAKAYSRAIATGDFDLGLKTLRQDLNVDGAALDREKFALNAAKAAAKADAQSKPASSVNPGSTNNFSDVENVQEFRRRLFGSIPEANPQASLAPIAPSPPPPKVNANPVPVPEPSPATAAPAAVQLEQPAPPLETPATVQAGLNQINSSIVLAQAIHEKWRLVKDSCSNPQLRDSAPVNFQTCVDNSAQVKQKATALRKQLEPLAAAATGPAAVRWQYIMNYFGHMLDALVIMSEQFQRVKFQNRIPLPGKDVSDAMTAITTSTMILCEAALQARDFLEQRLAGLSPPITS